MTVDGVLVVTGAAVLGLGLVSSLLKRVWLSAPLLALVIGVLLGPQVLDVLEPATLGPELRVLEELARVTLSVSLVATGLQISRQDLRDNLRRVGSLLTVGMAGMWAITSVGALLLLGVEPWVAFLIGGILSPTDPVVASSLVEGRLAESNLPRWLRRSLQLESGANDGLALGFVLVPALILAPRGDEGWAIAGEVALQVGLAAGCGLATGWLAAKLVRVVAEHEEASTGFLLVSALATGLLALGATHALGGTGVLASFIAGVTFSVTVGRSYAEPMQDVQSALERLVIVPVFLLFGCLLPWDAWQALGWAGVAFAAWVLLLRRSGPAALALAPTRTPRRGVAFLSWYGPLGVAAIYYTVFVDRYAGGAYDTIFAACTLAISVSVAIHTLTATPGVRRFAGRRATTTLRHPLRKGVDAAP